MTTSSLVESGWEIIPGGDVQLEILAGLCWNERRDERPESYRARQTVESWLLQGLRS